MLTRLTHAAIAFAITVVVYQAYVLLAVPLIEPPLVTKVVQPMTNAERQEAERATHKYRELLSAYFPPGHWTLTKPPITAENGQAMIVLDEFNPRDDGQVRVNKCAILFYPGGHVRGEPAPRDAVVIEAPQGATLQMDNGFRHGIGGIGQLQWAKLIGQITVRSDMREPGPHDDLLLTTHNVSLNKDLIYTKDVVEMQLGPHRGRGRELEIRLVATERSRASSQGPNLGGIDSLEIVKEVEAQWAPGTMRLGMLPSQQTQSQINHAPTSMPPVRITSGGRFRLDFAKQIASFNDQVHLTQVHPHGPLDELRCQTISIFFANAHSPISGNSGQSNLVIGSIEALGSPSKPVVLSAQSQQASARCERMRIEPAARRVTFDRGQEVMLTYQKSELHAKQIQYTAPPEESGQRIGNFRASGSGWLRAVADNKPDVEPFEVRWLENMLLRRIDGQSVLTLNGRPLLDMVGMGRLRANHLDLYLRESAADGSEASLLPADIVPERLVAGGKIAIDSEQIHGQAKQLEVHFDYVSNDLLLANPNGNNSRAARSQLGRKRGGLKRAYDITGETLRMLVTVRQKQPEITSIDIDGRVEFSESPAEASPVRAASKQPLNVVADHLRIENADSPSAKIMLSGKPATITVDGMSFRTENLQIHRGNSRAWVNAPGNIEMLVDRSLSGDPLPAPQLLTIRWQRSMELNQEHLTFLGNVQVQTTEGTLDTQQLEVLLTAPVQFDGAANRRPPEIAQLQCSGGANAIFSQRDALGLASLQTIKLEKSFRINLQTGDLFGDGPGLLESVHLSDGKNPLGDNAGGRLGRLASASPPRPGQPTHRLRFLGVQFVRGVQGNLNRRHVRLEGNVEAVYGPVDAWEQRIAFTKQGLPGPETVWINSQSLRVAESPLARINHRKQNGLGPLELEAKGKVTIEGPAGERGSFTTRSLLAKYDQSKKTFVLEGTNQQPASIMVQEFRNGPTSPTLARKITYHQETGNVNVSGLVSGQFRQISPGP